MKPSGHWAGFHIFQLSSGVSLFVQPTDRFKNVTMRLYFRTHLAEDPSGVAVLPHVLTRGTRRRETMAKISNHLDSLYGAHANADSGKIGESQLLSFRVDCVADRHLPSRSRNVRRGLEFLRELAFDPAMEGKTLRGDYVEQERHNQKRALEDLMSDRAEFAGQRCLETMCRGEAYAVHELGTLEGLDGVTAEGLTRRWREILKRSPMELYVSGRVDPGAVADACAALFDGKARSTAEVAPTVVDVPVKDVRRVTEEMDVEQGKLVMGYRTYTTFAHPGSVAMGFMNGILGGTAHSRLFVNVRERDGLAYSAGSSVDRLKGLLMVHAGIDPAKYEKCLSVIEAELESIRQGAITEEEMEATRRMLSERTRSILDSPSRAIASLYERRLAGQVRTVEESLEEIRRVRKEDVVEAARRLKLDTIYWLTARGGKG
ncbi:MAG: insulinase family protein [Candidatus Brocadiae bacterium]|nr:insulinase family protein [Candidatus Brocadiia bacterium]